MSVHHISHVHLPDPPEYASTAPVQHTQLMVGAPFTLNCTPSAANPPVDTVSIEVDRSPVTSGDTVTVTDNVVTIPSVQRSHSGNYSCTATNTRGSAVTYNNLLVVGVCAACVLVDVNLPSESVLVHVCEVLDVSTACCLLVARPLHALHTLLPMWFMSVQGSCSL